MSTPRILLAALLLGATALAGCRGSPAALALTSDENLALESEAAIINAYRYGGGSKRMRRELERRGTFTADEWGRIERGEIRIGDRALVVRASWGDGTVSRFTDAWGTTEVWSYGTHSSVVFRDGVVSAIDTYGR
jgi:hypothetical protein